MRNALRLQHVQAAVYGDETFGNTGVDTRSEQECPLVYDSESRFTYILHIGKSVFLKLPKAQVCEHGNKTKFKLFSNGVWWKGVGSVDTPIVEVGPYNLQKVRIPHDHGMLDYKLFNKMMYI